MQYIFYLARNTLRIKSELKLEIRYDRNKRILWISFEFNNFDFNFFIFFVGQSADVQAETYKGQNNWKRCEKVCLSG